MVLALSQGPDYLRLLLSGSLTTMGGVLESGLPASLSTSSSSARRDDKPVIVPPPSGHHLLVVTDYFFQRLIYFKAQMLRHKSYVLHSVEAVL